MNMAIDVKHLVKKFGDKTAVQDISLTVKRGEIFGFLGPNGSGKTTTIRMICGLLVPDAGEGFCLGYNIRTQMDELKKHVGYMTQSFSLYQDLTIRENLDFMARIYGIENRKAHVDESIAELGLIDRQHQLAGNLSGGWKQRLSLAAALLHKPQVLLLDEPTAGVDPKARRDFWDEIHRLSREGVTSLVSTHYMDEAERCHRLAYIAYGKLISQGTMTEIIDHAKLITWTVTGKDLNELSDRVSKLPGIQQATMFGNTLHISGHDETLMQKHLKDLQKNPEQQWQKIRPGLEDIFISLSIAAQEITHEK